MHNSSALEFFKRGVWLVEGAAVMSGCCEWKRRSITAEGRLILACRPMCVIGLQ